MPILIIECGDPSEVCIARADGVTEDDVAVFSSANPYQATLHCLEQLTVEQISKLRLWDLPDVLRRVRRRQRAELSETGENGAG